MEYQVIDTDESQLEQIEAIERQCFSCPWTLEQLRSQLSGERHVFLAAVDTGGAVLGYVGMMHVLDEGYISNVAVAPAYRRQGVAAALISALMTRAEKLNLAFVTLDHRGERSFSYWMSVLGTNRPRPFTPSMALSLLAEEKTTMIFPRKMPS